MSLTKPMRATPLPAKLPFTGLSLMFVVELALLAVLAGLLLLGLSRVAERRWCGQS